jgi:Peptidase family S41
MTFHLFLHNSLRFTHFSHSTSCMKQYGHKVLLTIVFTGIAMMGYGQKVSRAAALADVSALRTLLFHNRPAPTAYISRDSVETRLRELAQYAQLSDSIRFLDWEYQLRYLLASIGCGHTYVSGNKLIRPKRTQQRSAKFLPFRIYSDGQRAWIRQELDSTRIGQVLPGSEILSLQGRPIQVYLQRFRQYQPSDGVSPGLGVRLLNKDIFFNNLLARYYPDTAFSMVWRTPEGQEMSAVFNALPAKKLAELKIPPTDSTLRVLYRSKKKKQRFYYHPKDERIAVFEINSFDDSRSNRLLRKGFRDIRRRKTPYVVIDVRDNLGGDFNTSVNLARYLADKSFKMRASRPLFRSWKHLGWGSGFGRVGSFMAHDVFNLRLRYIKNGRMTYSWKFRPVRRNHFEGQKAFILVNGWSFSASTLMAAYAQHYGEKVVVIGDETGGGGRSNNGLVIPSYTLPGSKIKFNIPSHNLDYLIGPDQGRGVIPDIPVNYTIQEVLQQRDLYWEAVMQQVGATLGKH